ncbi:MAG: DUF2934 domain-containing protein [Phycisphaeraceae bacterium]|nr:DUF2934 domain-containing protein [Phycisphaeraceae bacterium]
MLEAVERPPLRIPNGPPAPTEHDIRRRAFEIHQDRAPHEGDALSDWLRAEHELWKAHLDADR